MSRIGFAAAIAATVGVSVTGCTSMLSGSSSSEQLQALNVESDPMGAEIRTTEGQTCITPCALTVPSQDQTVVISKDGYAPQTLQITTGPPPDHHFWQHSAPTLVPNPLRIVLNPVPKSVPRVRNHKSVSAPVQGPTAQGTAARFSAFPAPPPKQ